MYNNDSNSLNAGAPDIRLTGNQQMASDPSGGAELFQMYQNALQSGQIPKSITFEMFKELLQQSRAPRQNSGIMASAPNTYTQQRKQMMAYGGIAGADGRKAYGLGSIFQDWIKDPIERTFRGVDQSVLDSESQMRVDREDQVIRMDPRTGRQFDLSTYDPMTDPPLNDKNFPKVSSGPAYTPAYEKIFDPIRDAYGGITNALTQGNLTQFLPFSQRMTDEGQQGILPFGIQDFLNLRNLESLQPYLKKEIRPAVAGVSATTHPGYPADSDLETQREIDAEYARTAKPAIPEQAALYEQRVNPLYPIAAGLGVGKYVSGLPKDTLPADTTSINPAAIAAAARGTDAEGAAEGLRFLPEQVTRAAEGGRIGYAKGSKKRTGIMKMLADLEERFPELMMYGSMGAGSILPFLKEGGRVPAQEGGLMDMGGMEKDYREEGGFVPIGGKEKADDVPARLSKNEFVFTADAVRGAGGGDIDKGAEIMENMMKHLEAGGEVSEDSQGLEGARGMFANAQKLQNRIV